MASGFDKDRYDRDVLEPARLAGGRPPPDLFVRYALDQLENMPGSPDKLDRRTATAIEDRVREVVNHWQTLAGRRTHAKLARALLSAHAGMQRKGALDPETL